MSAEFKVYGVGFGQGDLGSIRIPHKSCRNTTYLHFLDLRTKSLDPHRGALQGFLCLFFAGLMIVGQVDPQGNSHKGQTFS